MPFVSTLPSLRSSLLILALVLIGLGVDISGAVAADGVVDDLRLIWASDPAHEAIVSWSTVEPATVGVYYDTEPRGGELTAYRNQNFEVLSGPFAEGGEYFHHALLEELQPSTVYYVVVEVDGIRSREYHFVTGAIDDRPFDLLFGGDSRSGRVARQQVNDAISSYFEDHPQVLALLHGGDYVMDGRDWEQWDAWMVDHTRTTTAEGRLLPILPTRGNHEGDPTLFNQVFGFPGGYESDYYSTVLGNDVFLVTLDTQDSHAGAQRDWLEEQLQIGQNYRWLITNYHRPAYPAVKAPAPAREHWVPLFEQYDVDLACESDGHALKRTLPIRNEAYDPTGVVYIGEGGLGVPQRTPDTTRWYLQAPGMTMSAHHFQVLSFHPEGLDYRAIPLGGGELDHYRLLPRRDGNSLDLAVQVAVRDDEDHVHVAFNKGVDPEAAADPSNYLLEPNGEVVEASYDGAINTVVLTVTGMEATAHTLQVSGVKDLGGRSMVDGSSMAMPYDAGPVTIDRPGLPDSIDYSQPPPADLGLSLMGDSASACTTIGGRGLGIPIGLLGVVVVAFWRRRRRRRDAEPSS